MDVEANTFLDSQIERMFSVAEAGSQRDRLFLESLYFTGARISEIIGLDTEGYADPLTPSSIDLDRRLIKLRNLKSKRFRVVCDGVRMGKDGTVEKCGQILRQGQRVCFCGSTTLKEVELTKRVKFVDVPDDFLEKLKLFIETNNIQPDQRIFPMSRTTGYRLVRKYAAVVGIKKVGDKFPHPHNFRHSFVMKLVRNQTDMKLIQKQTGHKNIASLGEYFGLTQDAHEQINKAFKKKIPQEENQGDGVSDLNAPVI